MQENQFHFLKSIFLNNFFKILIICFVSLIFFSGCIENNTITNNKNNVEINDGNNTKNILSDNIIGDKNNDFNFTTQELFNIVTTDLEYSEFTKFYPNFKPKLNNYFSLTKDEFDVLKKDWLEDSQKEVFVSIINNLILTKNTFFVEFEDTTNINNSLIAIIDMKEKKSLKLISVIKMNMGV